MNNSTIAAYLYQWVRTYKDYPAEEPESIEAHKIAADLLGRAADEITRQGYTDIEVAGQLNAPYISMVCHNAIIFGGLPEPKLDLDLVCDTLIHGLPPELAELVTRV